MPRSLCTQAAGGSSVWTVSARASASSCRAANQPSDQVGQVQRIGRNRGLAGFQPGQQQQRIDAALHARAGLDGRAQAAPGLCRIGIGQRGFGAGADFGQRGAQLMGHVPGKAAFARDRRVQTLQAGVEGLGEGLQLTRKVVADGLHGRFGVQRRDPGAGPIQQRDHMPDHQQTQADGQRQGQHDPAQQREMDVPFGAVPVLALGGHHQHARRGIGRTRRQARGQRPAGMAIGQHHVEIARRAAAFGAHRQRGAGAVGRLQQTVAVGVEHGEEFGVPLGLVFGHEPFQLAQVLLLQYPAHRPGARQQRQVHALVDLPVDPVVQRQKQHAEHAADAQRQTHRQLAMQ
jgi:hypothetical protein